MDLEVEHETIEKYLNYVPSDINTMTLEEKVDFLMKERLILGNIIAYMIKNIKEGQQNKAIFENINERVRIATYYHKQYSCEEARKRYDDAHEKGKEEVIKWKALLKYIHEESRKEVPELFPTKLSTEK